ncbi:MAG: ComEC family competence protein [Gammaproteobacteria bacterium]|nr:MAG: ComEC family competence protein [Gammaproteobacteria bacterium]
MAGHVPLVPISGDESGDNAAVQRPWRKTFPLSSIADAAESFLVHAGLDRGPWLVVAFAAGIALWFLLPAPEYWISALTICVLFSMCAWQIGHKSERWPHVFLAMAAVPAMIAGGLTTVWVRSVIVGTDAVAAPDTAVVHARVLERHEQPGEGRIRLVLAAREPGTDRAVKVRLNLPQEQDDPGIVEGALIHVKARLMPPSPPMLPGAYDFARAAWFKGLAATGSVVGPVTVVEAGEGNPGLPGVQRQLATHIREQLQGSPGAIAAALASGDRGAIAKADEQAMRDSGLTHLLSISGLHVSAVIGAVYVLTLKILALWPWFALRVRLPLVAAGFGAIAGIGYTLLTGSDVPTVRSCIGAILVLMALALGREPLSLRMVAVAMFCVLLLWPEALIGPSFQMSFAAVITLVALHMAKPVKAFLAPREEHGVVWVGRRFVMLLLTGLAIELALAPIVLFHFHRAGLYGAFANVIGIPLTTFATMPLIALALVLDLVGMGGPVWWLAGKSLELLLFIAHFTASQPGAVAAMPAMAVGTFALFVAGGLWLALWRGRVRLLGLFPMAVASVLVLTASAPDILISGDGRHLGIVGERERLIVLRDSRSSYAKDNLLELSGMQGDPLTLSQWPGARCSPEFCTAIVTRGHQAYVLLAARNRTRVDARMLARACAQADIVVADRYLPRNCQPRWIKADKGMLAESGGMAIYLDRHRVETVAQSQGQHGWWRGGSARSSEEPARTTPP